MVWIQIDRDALSDFIFYFISINAVFAVSMSFAARITQAKRNTDDERPKCDQACAYIYEPVCGYNGTEYKHFGNACMMKKFNCEIESMGIRKCLQSNRLKRQFHFRLIPFFSFCFYFHSRIWDKRLGRLWRYVGRLDTQQFNHLPSLRSHRHLFTIHFFIIRWCYD